MLDKLKNLFGVTYNELLSEYSTEIDYFEKNLTERFEEFLNSRKTVIDALRLKSENKNSNLEKDFDNFIEKAIDGSMYVRSLLISEIESISWNDVDKELYFFNDRKKD